MVEHDHPELPQALSDIQSHFCREALLFSSKNAVPAGQRSFSTKGIITLTLRWTRFVVLGLPHHLAASLEIRRCCLSAANLEIPVGAFDISEK
jgi:hypothetical protein